MENSKWNFSAGKWEYRKSNSNGEPLVLAQTAVTQPWAVAILQDPSKAFADVDITVKFRPISGREDASGGIIFRAKDAKNYYLVRANALENNFRIYVLRDGRRSQIAGATVERPKLSEWHTIRLVVVRDHMQAYLNGALLVDHQDGTYSQGYLGLWTKADSVTEFMTFQAIGVPIVAEHIG